MEGERGELRTCLLQRECEVQLFHVGSFREREREWRLWWPGNHEDEREREMSEGETENREN